MTVPNDLTWPGMAEGLRRFAHTRDWWADPLVAFGKLSELQDWSVADDADGFSLLPSLCSPTMGIDAGVLAVHRSAVVHPGTHAFGNVVVGPGCEVGPHTTIYGPTILLGECYIGPGVEIRRSFLFDRCHVAHLGYIGHSVIGRGVVLGALFCSAVRNLDGSTVEVRSKERPPTTTDETFLGCLIADGADIGVGVVTMPGRIIGPSRTVLPGTTVLRNLW